MPSFLDKLRSGSSGTSSAASAPNKKDGKDVPQTWLQKLAQDTDPVSKDGDDKFFGAENFGNTCYFNSMVQCLYYSVPFRDMVLAYPRRSPVESILNGTDGLPRNNVKDSVQLNGQATASPAKKSGGAAASARSAGVAVNSQKPEDKESPEYKKKQAMLHGPVLSVDYDNSNAYGMTPSLFTCLKDAFEAVIANKSRTGVLSMPRFLEKLRQENEMFRSPMHQDAHEFLNFLLNGVLDSVEEHTKALEEQENTGKEAPTTRDGEALLTAEQSKDTHTQFRRLFQGTLTSETRCLTCENVSQRDEPFLDLSVDLEQHSSVTSCLRQFSEEEMLCERDKFFCDGCGGLQEAEKRMKVKRLPKVLALHLKRFKYTEDLQRLHKLFERVVYPYQLRLFNTTDDAEDPDKLYELYAVVVHIGSGPYHGHYVSIIKTPNRGWLLFDDEMVEPVDKSFVRNFFGAQVGMACAYVLFYQETTLEKVKKEQEAEGLAAAAAATAAEAHKNPLLNEKDHQAAATGIKLNGNSGLHPPALHEEGMAKLSQVVTAPAAASSPITVASPTSAVPPMPNISDTAQSGAGVMQHTQQTKAEAALAKKMAAKEEKERKAAEKEREKSEKKRRKSMEFLSKAHAATVRNSMHKEKVPDLPINGHGLANHGPLVPDAATGPAAVSSPTATTPSLPFSTNESSSPTAGEFKGGQLHHHHPSSSQSASSPTSGWNKGGISSLSLKRSSKSISRKAKFWPSLSNSEGKSGSVAASLGPPPTSAPLSHTANTSNEPSLLRNGDDFAVEDNDSGPDGPDKEPRRMEHRDGDLASPSAGDQEATSPGPPKKRGFSMIRKKASSLMS